uniref:hypothetical protein n=1 Tax=Pseudomonas laurentiana TaxID=2364649 RepID=UPI0029C6A300|nr:hypothetical protein [Pseudomonas laurentiana]
MLVFIEQSLQQITRCCGQKSQVDVDILPIIVGERVGVAELKPFAHDKQLGQLTCSERALLQMYSPLSIGCAQALMLLIP